MGMVSAMGAVQSNRSIISKPADQTTADSLTPLMRDLPKTREPAADDRAEKMPIQAPVPVSEKEPAATGKLQTRKLAISGAAGVALLLAAWFGYGYWTVGRFIVSTDDAYVGADMSIIAPKIAAHVTSVPIVENQHVKAGDTLVQLDDGDFTLAVDEAAAKLATQESALKTFDAQILAADASTLQAHAQLDSYKATLVKTEADFTRTDALAQNNYSSKAALDAARAARDSAKAQVAAQMAAITSVEANVGVLKAQRIQSERVAKELDVALAKAKRDLSFTIIKAPFDGVIGNKSVQVGDYVTAGKRLAAVVPLDKVYVDANLKETQLARVAAGEKVKLLVDALGSEPIEGTVESIAPASGSQFSLLPPENATGNFTKIVQRVPVRIAIDAADANGKLRPGLSVSVEIDTRDGAAVTTKQASSER